MTEMDDLKWLQKWKQKWINPLQITPSEYNSLLTGLNKFPDA